MMSTTKDPESDPSTPEAEVLKPGTVLANRYEVRELLGEGGMGSVYKAHDRFLDEEVALKLLRSGFASTAEATIRFRSEIKLARKVTHKNVCRIHEYSEIDGMRFLSMEYVEGSNLKDLVRGKGGLAVEEARDIAIQIAKGLQAIHDRGIIHRDLKTANIMRDPNGDIRLMDFGIAKQWQEHAGEGLTGVGDALGTPEYMSPEQARGQALDFRSDIYSLGVCLFELLTGELPFLGKSALDTLIKHIQEPPPITSAIAEEFHPILEKSLAKEPADRYASARGVIADLRALGPEGRPESDADTEALLGSLLDATVALPLQPGPASSPEPVQPEPQAAPAEVDPAEVDELIALLRNPEVAARWRAAVALCQLGPGAAAALPAIEEAMDDAAPAVADAAVEAFRAITGTAPPPGQHRPGTEPTRPGFTTLLAQLRDKDTLVRWRAAVALGEIGVEAGVEATPSLVETLDDTDANVRSAAAMALGKLGSGAAAAVRPLAAALADEEDTIFRAHAARALGRIGPAAHEAVPGLIAALCDEDASVRDEITEALVRIGSAALPALLEALQDDDPRVRYEAAHAVTRLGTAAVPPRPKIG